MYAFFSYQWWQISLVFGGLEGYENELLKPPGVFRVEFSKGKQSFSSKI